ncbi:methyl-accepting chemotaxis protein [Vibrio paucivorans]
MTRSPDTQRFSLSIRTKLVLINLTLLLGVILYAYYEQTSLNKLDSLEHAANENLNASVDLLMLRRHEKDFLARKDNKYVSRFDSTFEQLDKRIGQLANTLTQHELNVTQQSEKISSTLSQYQNQFHQLANQVNLLHGPDSSLTASLSTSRDELKQTVATEQDFLLKVALLELIESDLSYLATLTTESISDYRNAREQFSLYSGLPKSVLSAFEIYQSASDKHIEAVQVLGLTANEGLRGALRNNVHVTEQAISELQQHITVAIQSASASIKNQLHLIGGAIVLLLSCLLYLIGRSILGRIKAINVLMKQIASGNGDLTVRMNAKGNDELAQLANSFDMFISSLHGHIKELAGVMHVLTESSCSSEKAAVHSMKNAEQQKVESESVATAVNELVMTTNEITANIESAAQNTERVTAEAQKALDMTHATGDRIDNLAVSIEDSQSHIMELEAQSREINQVISTIQGLTQGISDTVSKMQSSADQARTTNTHTHQVVEAIEGISAQISEIFDMNTQIATASEEQSMVSVEIDRNITQIAQLAGDTFEVVSGSVKCSEQVSGVSHKLESIVGQFKY